MVSERAFLAAAALIFAACAATTIVWSNSMAAAPAMPMPGGWTMSMMWMRMPAQSWPGAAASFLAMWTVMMAAMMQPCLTAMLWRFRQAAREVALKRLGLMTAAVGFGYLLVWIALGLAVYPAGIGLAEIEMKAPALARAVPVATGVVVVLAGALQFTAWKAGELACCCNLPRAVGAWPQSAGVGAAFRHGLRLGRHCVSCCAGLTAILLAVGVMDFLAMAAVTAAITAERLAPHGVRVARAVGVLAVAAGLALVGQAVVAG